MTKVAGFAVSAVILLVGVGNGASAAVQQQIEGLGSNLLIIYPANAKSSGGVQQGFGTASTLTMDDVKALGDRQASPDVDVPAAAPVGQPVRDAFLAIVERASCTPRVIAGLAKSCRAPR